MVSNVYFIIQCSLSFMFNSWKTHHIKQNIKKINQENKKVTVKLLSKQDMENFQTFWITIAPETVCDKKASEQNSPATYLELLSKSETTIFIPYLLPRIAFSADFSVTHILSVLTHILSKWALKLLWLCHGIHRT